VIARRRWIPEAGLVRRTIRPQVPAWFCCIARTILVHPATWVIVAGVMHWPGGEIRDSHQFVECRGKFARLRVSTVGRALCNPLKDDPPTFAFQAHPALAMLANSPCGSPLLKPPLALRVRAVAAALVDHFGLVRVCSSCLWVCSDVQF
jgi:hypothetical protein